MFKQCNVPDLIMHAILKKKYYHFPNTGMKSSPDDVRRARILVNNTLTEKIHLKKAILHVGKIQIESLKVGCQSSLSSW